MASAQTLSLTFDDGLNPDTQADARLWNQQILDTLKGSDISAMVFPALVRVGGSDGKGLALLLFDWSKAGHAVGNHTATHQSLASSKLSLNDFIADVKAADGVLRRFPTWEPMLRFPYLKEGETLEKRDGMRAWMKTSGYRPAPVSIDASDWYFNQIYAAQMKAGDVDKAVKVKGGLCGASSESRRSLRWSRQTGDGAQPAACDAATHQPDHPRRHCRTSLPPSSTRVDLCFAAASVQGSPMACKPIPCQQARASSGRWRKSRVLLRCGTLRRTRSTKSLDCVRQVCCPDRRTLHLEGFSIQ